VSAGPINARLVGTDRVLAVLIRLAERADGASLEDLARVTGQPKASVHRALSALVRSGLADKRSRGQYVLGDEFLRLAFTHQEARPDHVRVRPVLERLAERFSETAHYAVLDGESIVYRAKVDPSVGAVRLSSTIGGRNPAHATAVGKILLAHQLPDLNAVERWVGERRLERRTPRTAVSAADLHWSLEEARRLGFAIDDQENDPGVNCVAFAVHLNSSAAPSGAVSVSAVAHRTSLEQLVDAAGEISAIIADRGEKEQTS
jgi:DNA-binding IclR family transcriptional regulator